MNGERKERIKANEISEIRTYCLDGREQKILLEGRYKTNPIVIFLHGGPGSPLPFSEGCRGMFPELTERFIMVYWDQLGCGINNTAVPESATIESYVKMTVDLIKAIKADFPDHKVSLFGVSWGSVLAAMAATRVPKFLYHVLIYGQVLKNLTFNEEVYAALEHADMPPKFKKKLEEIKNKDVHTMEELEKLSSWIGKYTDGYQAKSGGKMPIGGIIWGILTSPDYKLKDFKAIMINGFTKNESLKREIVNIDLSEILKEISIPYRIMQGGTDIVTSTRAIAEYVKEAGNPNLQFELIEHNGHMPGPAAMDRILQDGFQFLA